mmetsp:Transcript_9259/g.12299  ORF Transcript_9259/g.12299 Transcript_9259/m.12299 type:complete len:91 (-) Transcript_9259:245-517(-)
MLERGNFENTLADTFSQHGLGSTIWSPLCMGLLTGKYNNGAIPEGGRFAQYPHLKVFYDSAFGSEEKAKKTSDKFNAIQDLAKKHDLTMA